MKCVLSAMIVVFPVDGELFHVLAGYWLDHYIFMLLTFVFLFSSICFTRVPVPCHSKHQQISRSLFSPVPAFPSYTNVCWLSSLKAATGTKEASKLPSNAAWGCWPTVMSPFRCSLCVLLCGAAFLNFVLAPYGERKKIAYVVFVSGRKNWKAGQKSFAKV